MSLAVAILSLPSLVLWIWISIGVVVRLLGGAADRDLDHRNRPGRNPKCSREPAFQAGFRPLTTVPRTRDSPQVAGRAPVFSRDDAAHTDDRLARAVGDGRPSPFPRGQRSRRRVHSRESGPRHRLPRRTGRARRGFSSPLGNGGRVLGIELGTRAALLDGAPPRPR